MEECEGAPGSVCTCVQPQPMKAEHGRQRAQSHTLGHGAHLLLGRQLGACPPQGKRPHRGTRGARARTILPAYPFSRTGLFPVPVFLGHPREGHECSGPAGEESGAREDSEHLPRRPGTACGVSHPGVVSEVFAQTQQSLASELSPRAPWLWRQQARIFPFCVRGVRTTNQCHWAAVSTKELLAC